MRKHGSAIQNVLSSCADLPLPGLCLQAIAAASANNVVPGRARLPSSEAQGHGCGDVHVQCRKFTVFRWRCSRQCCEHRLQRLSTAVAVLAVHTRCTLPSNDHTDGQRATHV